MSQNSESAIAHLSKEQLDNLIAEYYAGKPIKALLSKYGVQCCASYLYKAFPPVIREDLPCPYCKEPMHQKRPSRASFGTSYFRIEHYCPACGHRDKPRCRCRNCTDAFELNKWRGLETKRKQISVFCRHTQLNRRGHVSAEELSLLEAVALLTLTRTCTFLDELDSQGNVVLGTLTKATLPMAPRHEFVLKLIRQLMDSKLISVSDSSSVEAFEFQDDELAAYFYFQVNWALSVDEPLAFLEQIEKLAADSERWPEIWHQDAIQLWQEIALHECKEYFAHAAADRGLPPAGTTSTETMLKNLLNYFSVSQCYRIIYMGAQQAADFLVRKQCTKIHAANYMIGACQRWADKARAEKWEVGHFRRQFDLPRSVLSHVLFDVFLGIGERGFTELPSSQLTDDQTISEPQESK